MQRAGSLRVSTAVAVAVALATMLGVAAGRPADLSCSLVGTEEIASLVYSHATDEVLTSDCTARAEFDCNRPHHKFDGVGYWYIGSRQEHEADKAFCDGLGFELYPPPECDDGVHNGYETDVDCGSSVAVGALEFDSKRTSSDPTAKVKVDVDERVQLAGRTFTIALWVKFQDDFMGGRQVLVSDKSLDGGLEWSVLNQGQFIGALILDNNGNGPGSRSTVDSSDEIQSSGNPAFLDSTRWYHLAAVYHHTDSLEQPCSVLMYIDGVEVAVEHDLLCALPRTEGTRMALGGSTELGNTAGIHGLLNDVTLWYRALEPWEIVDHMSAACAAPFLKPPTGSLPLESLVLRLFAGEPYSGSVAFDTSGVAGITTSASLDYGGGAGELNWVTPDDPRARGAECGDCPACGIGGGCNVDTDCSDAAGAASCTWAQVGASSSWAGTCTADAA